MQGVKRGYKRLQGVTSGYKRLQVVTYAIDHTFYGFTGVITHPGC